MSNRNKALFVVMGSTVFIVVHLTTEYAPRRSYFPWKVAGTSSTGMLKVRRFSSAGSCVQNCENPRACFSQNYRKVQSSRRPSVLQLTRPRWTRRATTNSNRSSYKRTLIRESGMICGDVEGKLAERHLFGAGKFVQRDVKLWNLLCEHSMGPGL